MRLKLGITGRIGSGKSTVCKIFNVLGIPVFSADDEARIIMDTDIGVIERVNSITGINLYNNGTLDRKYLAELIFNNNKLLHKINRLVHPKVLESFLKWVKLQTSHYMIMESAILFESGASSHLDMIATVTAPLEERISRVMKRNNLTREQVMDRVRNQKDDEEKARRSDFVINNGENDMIIPEILKIHDQILHIVNEVD